MIQLSEINESNFFAARALDVAPEQRGFLDSAAGILARGYLYRRENARVWAIEADGAVVGLALVKDMDEAPACYDLQQFMIDAHFQRRGFGGQALRRILERLAAEGKYDCVEVCVKRDDAAALRLYERAGFADTGYVDPDAPDCLNLMYRLERAPAAEVWDAYDADLNPIAGATLTRGEPIPDGQYHLVCDVLVRHADGSYLLMRRDPRKHYGGLWEATAGGSALKGETPLQCAVRELREETGIRAEALTEVGRVRSGHTGYVEFLCETDWPKDAVTLQAGETDAYRWVSREELLAMKSDRLVTERMQAFIEELKA